MKKVSGLILFVFFSMFMEDALYAHAGAADLSPSQRASQLDNTHDLPPSDHDLPERDITHFGHCSFLLVEPLYDFLKLVIFPRVKTPYRFSHATLFLEKRIRPPIRFS